MTWGILWRDAGWPRLLFSALVLAAAGGLAAFMVALLAVVPFDRFYYSIGMDYQSRVVSGAPLSGRSLHVGAATNVSPQLPENAEGLYLQSKTLMLVQPLDNRSFTKSLASSLTSGTVSSSGVVVDEASLASWGTGLGGKVVLQGVDATEPCVVSVTGSTRPTNSDGGLVGQILVPQGVCAKQVRSVFAADPGSWVTYDHPGGTGPSSTADAFNSLGASVSYGLVVLVVSVLAGGLWVLVLWRTATQFGSRTARSALSLVWIGASPKQLARAAQGILFGVSICGSLSAAIVAKQTLMITTRFFVQPALVFTVGAAMIAIALLVGSLYFRGWPVAIRSSVQKGEL